MSPPEAILGVICARGGSKGVPNKNIREVAGRPLIAHTIEDAKNADQINKTVVSTDSADIIEVAEEYGACVPFKRPAKLATDEAAKLPSVQHAHETMEELDGKTYNYVVDLDPTAPIRTSEDIENALNIALEPGVTEIQSATRSEVNPYYNMVEPDEDGFVQLSKTPSDRISRRQDTPLVYALNGSIAVYSREFLTTAERILDGQTKVYEMKSEAEITIDRPIDLELARLFLK